MKFYPTQWVFQRPANGMGMTDLGGLDSSLGNAPFDINTFGQVVGFSEYRSSFDIHTTIMRAFITEPNGVGMTDMGTLGGDQSSATGINDSGEVVGWALTANGESHAFITGPNGVGMTDMGTLGGSGSTANAINNSGQVAGVTNTADNRDHAFITDSNGIGMTDLGTLGGNQSVANDINDSGQVVGWASTANNETHAFITGSDGVGMTDLGTLGGDWSYATGINDFGEVVGMSTTADGDSHAFIFSHGVMTDLSLLAPVVATGWHRLNVFDINNNGLIVGDGVMSLHGVPHPFLLLPIPEPETYTMLLAGLGLLGFVVRRRKQMRCS